MARPTKRQKFIKLFTQDLESDYYEDMRLAIYKELILHYKTGEPRWLFDTVMNSALSYYDYMITKDKNLTPEELITDLGDVVYTELTEKMIQGLNNTNVL